jgi:hypothetical protein
MQIVPSGFAVEAAMGDLTLNSDQTIRSMKRALQRCGGCVTIFGCF